MEKPSSLIFSLIFVFLSVFSFSPAASAKTDLSITATDITFSKETPLAGETIRVFARVFNLGETDVLGYVLFLENGQEMADPQPISVKASTYDDVFIDWQAKAGTSNIEAKIISTNLVDDSPENDIALREDYFVDSDTDGDLIGNLEDTDDDNDGLSDEEEGILGTDSLSPDSDKDNVRDSIDPFPLDPTEWQDSDQDGKGDNTDEDDDNDGLTDEEELFVLGSNPLNPDSDQDGLPDKEEKEMGTDLLNKDTDDDGKEDSQDDFPLDPTRYQASILEVVQSFGEERNLPVIPILAVAGLIIIFFIFSRLFLKR